MLPPWQVGDVHGPEKVDPSAESVMVSVMRQGELLGSPCARMAWSAIVNVLPDTVPETDVLNHFWPLPPGTVRRVPVTSRWRPA
ncbi:hypothetical protein [Xanthomonas sp. NCPPB 2632]|uniref:hypothetical protein n=1 Tax=Xanthomonas sp. NCPPB 2632 TaxID=3240912 RepID=UPI0035167E44